MTVGRKLTETPGSEKRRIVIRWRIGSGLARGNTSNDTFAVSTKQSSGEWEKTRLRRGYNEES